MPVQLSGAKLFCFRLCRRPTSTSDDSTVIAGPGTTQGLAVLVQMLTIAEKAAGATAVPCLKGAIGVALSIVECAQGYKSNNESLHKLALSCGNLIVDITYRVQSGPGIADDLGTLVTDLLQTLQASEKLIKDMSSVHMAKRLLAQKENRDKIDELRGDVRDAQAKFQTLALLDLSTRGQSEAIRDKIYSHDNIILSDSFATGDKWVAFTATDSDSGKAILVKRYTSSNQSVRKLMHANDLQAFKKNWDPHRVQYMGISHPKEEFPYIVLRGVTSDHVSHYIALQFRKDNKRGSTEALRLLKDLTNAFAYIIGSTDSSSFDISKVHLNDCGKLMVVDLEPCLQVTKKYKNDLPYWQNWQKICIELLAGDPAYEPNPMITYHTDPTEHARLEYLRPILGHIHAGGLRFKDDIESAFKRQGLMLSQYIRQLENIQLPTNFGGTPMPTGDLLLALWHRSRELHYVAHFNEPLDMDVGDIGYIINDPPQFVRLDNVYEKIHSGREFPDLGVQHLRFTPPDRWTTGEVQGVVRHTFRFDDYDSTELAHWLNGRARLAKDYRLRRINIPSEPGLVVDCARAWDCLAMHANDLAANHTERIINPSDLILVVYLYQQSGYASFGINNELDSDQWRALWNSEGFDTVPEAVYFYESPPGGSEGVWGYFSFSPTPGTPHRHWTPETDDAGESWGWTFISQHWTIEISKPHVKEYIRYVQL